MIKSSTMNLDRRDKTTSRAVSTGLVANIFLACIKTIVGITGHSPALLAEGINSTSDIAYYVVSIVFMRLARKPADQEHPYGHRQLESIAALVVGSFIMTTAVAVFWDAVNKVYDLLVEKADYSGAAIGALWVAVFTVCLKVLLTYYTQKVGRQTDNPMIVAMAFDHRNDIFSASAAGNRHFPGAKRLSLGGSPGRRAGCDSDLAHRDRDLA